MTGAGRPPVVLLHALLQDSSMWEAQRRALIRLGHRVLVPDQRGFGRTPLGDREPAIDLLADDVARLLDDEGIDRAAVIGSSMGGYVAMDVLRRHPDRVAALGLLASRATADSPADRVHREWTAARCVNGRAWTELLARLVPALTGRTTRATRPAVTARVRRTASATDPASLAWALHAIADRPCSLAVLHEARVPSAVIAGAEDDLVHLDEMRAAAAALPHGRLVVIPDAGHLPPLETPEPVAEALHGLLQETSC
ncbi:alpha/beta fold hydrolase [Streptomyces sp.]|uniref:alpha/beta fold hydrolase n=1 Tax=Streptomyces sp. TaxID=1931 RepID=UPI002F405B02